MKKKLFYFAILLCSVIVLITLFLLYPKVKEEKISSTTSVADLFEKSGHFFVYFERDDCPYCDNIRQDIDRFRKKEEVLIVNAETCVGLKKYNWELHEKNEDILIGEKDDTGNIKYYNSLNESQVKKQYPALLYKIVWANENFAAMHDNKESGKIYAVSTRPTFKPNELTEDNFILAGVPTLVEFDDHKVINYYFDDKEIINFLESDTKPVDSYWNLD